jgi:iron(III) transport system permease protein
MQVGAEGDRPHSRRRAGRVRMSGAEWLQAGLLIGSLVLFVAFLVLPVSWLLGRSLHDESGGFIGLANFIKYFSTPSLAASLYNTLFVSTASTLIAVSTAFVYAYALTRTKLPGGGFFRAVAMIPIYSPTMLFGLGLVFLFGRQGMVTTGLFGKLPAGLDIGLYGPVGVIIAGAVFTFPAALLILIVALRHADRRLYDAAAALGASPWRAFWTVTVPGCRYGLLSAAFVCFVLCFTDFGAPKIVGGNYPVLAVDIYKQVIGQQNFSMGATVSVVLLVPTMLAFGVSRVVTRRQVSAVSSQATPLEPRRRPGRDAAFGTICVIVAAGILLIVATAAFASFVHVWPYSLSHADRFGGRVFSLEHYDFRGVSGGYNSYFNSLRMAALTAIAGTVVTFLSAYLIEKMRRMRAARAITYVLSIIPLALPGLVIGLAYIVFFNRPEFGPIPNPLRGLYGTMTLLVVCNIVHFYGVSFLTATTALKQIERDFEEVASSLGVPFYVTFLRVTLPVCLPAVLEIAMYFFVSAMATVSAVIFLAGADTGLASVAVINMEDAGDTQAAVAMCLLMLATNLVVRLLYDVASMGIRRSTQAWTRR